VIEGADLEQRISALEHGQTRPVSEDKEEQPIVSP
jgi:hypothetical protein